jgi:hypothetical protein
MVSDAVSSELSLNTAALGTINNQAFDRIVFAVFDVNPAGTNGPPFERQLGQLRE